MARKGKPMWTNKKTITAIKKKRDMYTLYCNTRDDKDYVQYGRASNLVKAEVRKAVRDFGKRIATEVETNPKGFFKYAWSKLKTNPRISDLEQRDGTMATDSAAKAEVLNMFLTSVFREEDQERLPAFEKRPCSSELTHLNVTSGDVKQLFGKLTKIHFARNKSIFFMFAMECASKLHKCGCSSFDVETINNEFRIEVGTGQILLPYGMPDKQYQREAVDIYNTSKVQYIHDIKGEGHIPPNTTTYDHLKTFTSKQIKFTWY